MANKDKENKIKKFTKEAIGKTLNQFNKEIEMADLVEINKNQDRILNGILSQVNDESTEKTEKSNIITLDNSTDGIVELKEIQGDTNVNVSKIEEDMPITHDIGDKEGNVFTLNEITQGAISIGEIQGNTMVNCNKDDEKELVLMKDLSTEGYSNVTLTEGVDGGLVDVALEGNTMVNVCNQKDPVAITKSYTVETGNHVALQGEYDGKCRPIVTGNTLVNLWSRKETDFFIQNGSFKNGVVNCTTGWCCTKNVELFKPNTEYTVITHVISISGTDTYLKVNDSEFNGVFTSDTAVNVINKVGIFVDKLTTRPTITSDIVFGVRSIFIGEGSITYNMIILEGDYTNKPIPGYFEGLQSSFEDKVVTQEMVDAGEELAENLGKYKVNYVVTGKNKFKFIIPKNINNITSTKLTITNNEYLFEKTEDFTNSGNQMQIYYEGNLKNKIFKYSDIKCYTRGQWVVPTETHLRNDYLQIVYNWQPIDKVKITDLMLVEREVTDLTYEPYKEYKKTFYLNSPLLDGDTIEQQGDNVVHVHRSEQEIFNGDETFTKHPNETNNTLMFTCVKNNVYDDKNAEYCYSDKFISKRVYNADKEGFYSGTDLRCFRILKSKLPSEDVNGFKAWLQSNPTTVVYRLQTPQYEVISENDTILCDSYVNGHLDIDSVVPIEKVDFLPFEEDLTYLYANTQYAVQFVSDAVSKVDITLGGAKLLNQNVVVGTNKYMITTPSELIDNNLALNGEGFNASNIVVTEATDQDFGYFEGMKSVGECEDLEVVSSNSDSSQSATQTLTHEPLRAVGDAKDKYVLIDGKWYIERNCGEVVLDGSDDEVWSKENGNPNGTTTFYLQNNSMKKLPTYINAMLCNRLKVVAGHQTFSSDNCISGYANINNYPNENWIYIFIKVDTVDDLKQYLQQNPTTVIYQLATPQYEPIDYNPFTVYSEVTHISNNSTIPCNMTIKNTGYNCLLKPSTTYTVSSNLGLNTVTTPSTLTEDCLRFYDTDTSTVTTMNNVTVLEGDWSNKADLIPSNFSGIESCFEQELVTDENDEHYGKYRVNAKVVGKNLSPINSYLTKLWTGNIKNHIITKLDLKQNTEYTLSISKTDTVQRVKVYYADRNNNINSEALCDNWGMALNPCTFTTPNKHGMYYLVIYGDGTTTINNIQIEQGDTATAYEPYKENNITFYINEPLRGIGTTKDKVFIQDDKVVVQRNCGSYIINDGSNFKIDNHNNISRNNVNRFIFNGVLLPDAKDLGDNGCSNICNILLVVSNIDTQEADSECISIRGSVEKWGVMVCVKQPSVVSFNQWIQQNPITMVYELAEPTYEEVEYSSNRLILDTFNNESFNNSTLFLNTNISPKISLKSLFEELVYVKPNTKYYIQFNAVGSGEVVINLGGTELTTEIVEGYNCIPITTPSESTNLLTIDGHGIKISEVVVSESVCSGYYKGLQSCFEEHMENGKYRVLLRGIALDGSKVNGIKLYINEPLRGIGNTKDRLCIKNGKLMVERKCKEVVFDGSTDEKWINFAINTNNNQPNTAFCEIKIGDNSIKGICESYKEIKDDIWGNIEYDSMKAVAFRPAGYVGKIQILIPKSYLTTLDIMGFRNYLNQNPIKIVYTSLTPIYEEVINEYGLPIVFEGYENGIVYIDSVVTPTTHIKYTSNNQLATTLAEAEEQNNSTQDDINMNVVTYMMDIDMLLTEKEMSNDISVMAVRRDNNNENMLDRMSEEDKKVYQDNTVVMLEKMITAQALEKEDIEGRIDMYYNKNRISKEQYNYLKSLL